jgi:hypothetical protein
MLQTTVVAIRSVVTYVAILVYIAVAAPLALVFGSGVSMEGRHVSARAWRRRPGSGVCRDSLPV